MRTDHFSTQVFYSLKQKCVFSKLGRAKAWGCVSWAGTWGPFPEGAQIQRLNRAVSRSSLLKTCLWFSYCHVRLFVTPWTAAHQAFLSFTILLSLLKFISTELVTLYLTILSSAAPFSSCPQSFPASGSFPISQFFASGGQSFGASAKASAST